MDTCLKLDWNDVYGTDNGPAHSTECDSTIYAYLLHYDSEAATVHVQAKCVGCGKYAAEFDMYAATPSAKEIRARHELISSSRRSDLRIVK